MRSQTVIASRRNIRYQPYAFTEHGVAMLSAVPVPSSNTPLSWFLSFKTSRNRRTRLSPVP